MIQRIGQGGRTVSCVRLLDSMLRQYEKETAKDVTGNLDLLDLLERADKEYHRVKQIGDEYYLAVFNPAFLALPPDDVIRILKSIGSTCGTSGEWAPVVVKKDSVFYRIWGNTTFCG